MKKQNQNKISVHYRLRSDGALSDILVIKWNIKTNPSFVIFTKYGISGGSRWDTYTDSAEKLSGAIYRGGWHTLIKGYASPSKSSPKALADKALKLFKKDPTLWQSQTTTTD